MTTMLLADALKYTLLLILVCCKPVSGTIGIELEDKLETEIDLREPRSFSDKNTKILSVRPTNFDRLAYNKSGVISYGNTLDSGTFARRYCRGS